MNDNSLDRFFRRRAGRRQVLALAGGVGATTLLAACGGKSGSTDNAGTASTADATSGEDANVQRPSGWTDESHGSKVDPNFTLVFPADRVNQLTITVPSETWDAMLANMTTIAGARGTGGQGGAGRQQGIPQGGQAPADGAAPVPGGQQGQVPGGGGGAGGGGSITNPDWFKATIGFEGKSWTNVGLRFKGNSTLRQSWGTGTDRMPFKLDFDEWEDDHPEIKNQRFYGFKQLSLSNNTGDASYIRETVAYDLLEASGLVAANTALYEVVLERGTGPTSLGIYTVIEVVDDTVLDRSFKDGGGNIYEADGQAATFAAGTDGAIQTSFEAEGGENPDWSDVKALYAAIHATTRTSDAAAWRSGLEKVFDVDGFMKWLAIAAVIGHWDTYGAMSHNYYLYNDPTASGRMTFISWDHNFVMGASMGGGGAQPGGGQVANGGQLPGAQQPANGGVVPGANQQQGGRGGAGGGLNMNTSLDKVDVGTNWPLIRFLMDDPVYKPKYIAAMKAFVAGPFDATKLAERYASYQKLIATRASAADAQANATAMTALSTWTQTRIDTVKAFLATA